MAFEFIRYEKQGRIAKVTIDRAAVMNALHPPANQELSQAFDETLGHALQPDDDPDSIWAGAERLAARLASASVGAQLLVQMRAWTV